MTDQVSRLKNIITWNTLQLDERDGNHLLSFSTKTKFSLRRLKEFFTMEPETLDWIRSLDSGKTFLDIGANVGSYSIFAARVKNMMVYAFEPHFASFNTLNENIILNHLNEQVTAFPFAISQQNKITTLKHNSIFEARSLHTIEQSDNPSFIQGIYSCQLLEILNELHIKPQYIKIDVDGLDHQVVYSLGNYLKGIESILIELEKNKGAHDRVKQYLIDAGFKSTMHPSSNSDATTNNWIFRK